MSKYRLRRRVGAQQLFDEFEDWLLRERSVGEGSAKQYVDRVVTFAQWLPDPLEDSVSALTPATLTEWVDTAVRNAGCKQSTLKKRLVMVRAFLRFCHRSGRTSQDLSGLVPNAAAWRLSSIPDPVPDGTVETLLASLDLQAPKGLRDRAIILLLAGLGLRSCEVSRLRLDDIGWRTGSLRIRGKGGRVDEMPLPQEVGDALEEYILHGRCGRAEEDLVFLTMFEPVRPVKDGGITKILRMCCARAGITEFGAHRLRHTFATGLLAAGSTLQEIQTLLRHVRTDTTAIYAKVDHARLAELVLPWPKAAQGRQR
ncbi:MAG: site-specific integrase [Bifidobacteriaceae bacterium]|jgi:site-specific recombinase XerD|nr:site-specific integrase [Bifidobacteriaceae bacterium]